MEYYTNFSSSNVLKIGYDEASSTLEVHYKNGVYRYYDVPAHIAEALRQASSKGQFIHQNIKGQYRYARV